MRESATKTKLYVRRLAAFVPIIIALVMQPILVAQSPTASALTTEITFVEEHFDNYDGNDASEPDGWEMIGTEAYASAANSGLAIPGVAFSNDNDRATVSYSLASNQVSKSLSFWMRNVSGAGSSLVVDQMSDSVLVKTTTESIDTDTTEETKTVQLEANVNSIKFTMQKFGGNIAFDDIVVTGEETVDTTKPTTSLAIDEINPLNYSLTAHDDEQLSIVTGNLYGSSGLIKSCSKSPIDATDYTLTCPVLSTLDDGVYGVRYNAKDTAGNMAITVTTQFLIDHTKPSAVIASPSANEVLHVGTFTVSGTAMDGLTGVERVDYTVTAITELGGSYASSIASGTATGTENWSFDVANLRDGFYRLKIQAFDGAGNWKYAYHDVHIDSRKPVTTVHTATGQTYASGDIIVEATTTDADSGITNAVMNLYGVGGLIKSCVNDKLSIAVATYDYTCTLPVASLEDGEYYLRINSHDAAANVSNTVTWNFAVDTTPPELFITLPSKTTIYSPGIIVVKGTVDTTAIGTIGVTFDGDTKQAFTDADGNWAVTFVGTALGEYDIVATAQDAFGNIATVTRENIVVKAVPPAFVVTPVNPPELPPRANENAQHQAANLQNAVVPTNTIPVVVAADTTGDENDTEVLADETVATADSGVKAAETTSHDALASQSFSGIAKYWRLIMLSMAVGIIIFTLVRWRRSR